jgi:1,4-alpha-glucan branching enzyme
MVKKKYFKTKDECIVIFELRVENAESVVLVGEFNSWQPVEMKQAKNGPFRTKLRLPKEGRFQFRYLINEQNWENDETADAYLTNEYGGKNSVVTTFSVN